MREEETLHFLTLWAVNGAMDAKKMKCQLDDMKRLGLDGTVFHPRFYPGEPEYLSPEYMDVLSEVILHAKQLGLEFWIYDENGWPSGRADGKVMEHRKDCLCEWLVYEGGRVQVRKKQQVNTLSSADMECFVQITYEGYRIGLSAEAFEYVSGFFSDEVGFLDGHGVSMSIGGVPWCDEIGKRYSKTYGEQLEEQWELLFCEKDGHEQVRYRFWEIAADVLAENFYRRICNWCRKYGKKYTAHLKGEENLFFQISPSGSAFRNLKEVSLPGIDALERYPGNHYYPRIASSIAKQYGDGTCMAEAMGGGGWGLSPKDMENYVDWLAESGITTYIFHISQYRKNSASVRDWPPDIPFGLNWSEAFYTLLARLHQKWDGRVVQRNPVLLVAPTRRVMSEFNPTDAMMLNEHNGAGTPKTKSGLSSIRFGELVERMYDRGMQFDVAEEWMVESGTVSEKYFLLGKQKYTCVIFSRDCMWADEDIPGKLLEAGIGHAAEEFSWKFVCSGENQLLLEKRETILSYRFHAGESPERIQLRSMDALRKVEVMGKERKGVQQGDWFFYEISSDILIEAERRGVLEISWEPEREEQDPFVYLTGRFRVGTNGKWKEQDKHQWSFAGVFSLEPYKRAEVDCGNLIRTGFPFMRNPVEVESRFYASRGKIRLSGNDGLNADAARVWVDGKDYGYVWSDDEIDQLSEGLHDVRVQLFPSTYNCYGPHHHYQGDRHLISPMQYQGEKNFADLPDAPDKTKTDEWHFVKYGII